MLELRKKTNSVLLMTSVVFISPFASALETDPEINKLEDVAKCVG